MSSGFEWASKSGDQWAARWRDTGRALAPVGDALNAAVLEAAQERPFDAFDIGCGAGDSSLALAASRPDARIVGADLSPALIEVAKQRAAGRTSTSFIVGDAVATAQREGPFDLFLSRHGVMFFEDPPAAFRGLRDAAREGARLVFSCFQGWEANPWASQLASAAAGRKLPPPGREPSGFAFADPAYVTELLEAGGWAARPPRAIAFDYVAGEGEGAVEQALDFLTAIGPASAVLREMSPDDRGGAIERMRNIVSAHLVDGAIRFPAAAWIWTAARA